MTLRTLHGVTVIPSEAVQSGQNGQFVFVLNPDQTVVNRPVKLGQSVENQIVVDSGVAPGETVITDGQMRLVPGGRVRVVNPVNGGPVVNTGGNTGADPAQPVAGPAQKGTS